MTPINNNPYVGPRTFTQQDGDRFFGREWEARELASLVICERLVLFYAQSGAGKSSLINTRLMSQLQVAGFAVLPVGRVSGELPQGATEVANIFAFNLMLNLDQTCVDLQRFKHLSLTDFLAGLVSDDGRNYHYEAEIETKAKAGVEVKGYIEAPHVLIIDQFEEIITTHSTRWAEREDFFRQLDQAMTDDPLLWVVLVFREDYLASIELYAPFLSNKMRARFYMQRMGYESALEAIKKPAELGGRPFAAGVAESLVDNLRQVRLQGIERLAVLAAVRPGETVPSLSRARGLGQFVEPVQLQVVCYHLWENLQARPAAEITRQDVQELGNVDTALAGFYAQAITNVLAETGEAELDLRDWIEHKLITEAGTRGNVYRGADKTEGISTRAADLLVNQFLLRTENRAGGIWYELVHDRFIEPILQANQSWREQQPLLQQARAWARVGKSEHQLLAGQALQDALAQNWQALGPLVAEFLTAAQAAGQVQEARRQAEKEAQQQRELVQARLLAEAQAKAARRLRLTVVALTLFILTSVSIVGLLFYIGVLQAEGVLKDAVITTSLALDGQRYIAVAPNEMTINVINTAEEELLSLNGHTAEVTKLNLSPDEKYLASADASGVILIWNPHNGQLIKRLTGHEDTIRYVVFSHKGEWLATGGDDGTTRVWDTATWQEQYKFNSESGSSIISVAFWPDDTRLVTATNEAVYTIWILDTQEKWRNCKVEPSGLEC